MKRIRGALPLAGLYAVSIGLALVLCAILVAATGGSALKVSSALLDGSLRSKGAWGLTLTTAVPLLLVATGTILATKAGLVNIGQEGQLLLGAAGAAFAATRLQVSGPLLLVLSFAFGALLGALWAGIAALMRFRWQVPEVISTLLLSFIAFDLTLFGLTKRYLLLTREHVRNNINSGTPLPASARMPHFVLFGNVISWGAAVAIVLAAVASVYLGRTTSGFRLRMLGLNARTARRAGVSAAKYGGTALVVSGAFAGLGGGLWLTSGAAGDRFTNGISSNIGWQGLLVALLARDRVLLAVPMAFVFAALRTGSSFLSATGVERRIADVVQAMLVLALLVPPAVDAMRRHRAPREASLA